MPKIAQGIYLRGKTYWYTVQEKKKRRFISLKTSNEVEAIERAARAKRDETLAITVKKDTFSEEIARYLESKRQTAEHGARTTESSGGALRQFAVHVNEKSVKNITPDDVRGFLGAVRKRVKPNGNPMSENSVHTYFRALRGFFTWTVKTAKLRFESPCKDIKLGKATQVARIKFATKKERDLLIKNASDDMKFVLYCAFHAGMRFNEIVEARPDWFNLTGGYVSIQQTPTFTPKNKKTRTVPLTPPFKAFLSRYGLRTPFVLRPDVNHGQWRYRWDFSRPWEDLMRTTAEKLNKEAKKARKKVTYDFSWITPHTGRHTFASHLVQEGLSMYKVAEWLGDTIQVATRHYAHLEKSDKSIEALV
jgi:site-specific recombinase XerD